jgi:hypothetical protein
LKCRAFVARSFGTSVARFSASLRMQTIRGVCQHGSSGILREKSSRQGFVGEITSRLLNVPLAFRMKAIFCVFVLSAFVGCSRVPSQIRVQNLMERDLSNVTIATNSFGALSAGATSGYQVVPAVFESTSVYATETNGYFRNDRFMGGANKKLASGSYTYVLRISRDGGLEVMVRKD